MAWFRLSRGFVCPLRRCLTGPRNSSVSPQSPPAASAVRPALVPTSGKTNWEVFRGWLVFKMLTFDWITVNGMRIYSASKRILGRRLTLSMLKATVAGQFLGGFSKEEARQVADSLASRNLCSIWNYSAEQVLSGEQNVSEEEVEKQEVWYNKVNEYYLTSIEMASQHNYQESPVKLAAIKVTPLAHPNLLLKMNKMLAGAKSSLKTQVNSDFKQVEDIDHHHSWIREQARLMNQIEFPENLSKLEEISQVGGYQGAPFTSSEKQQLTRLLKRLDDIGECARTHGVRILVDGEESRLQLSIHHLTVNYLMPHFNRDLPIFYNTVQAYLKGSFETLLLDIAMAKEHGFLYGVKIVRGAYMEMERQTAAMYGGVYPIHPDKPATNRSYNRAVHYTLRELVEGVVGGMVVASHNQESVELVKKWMKELGLSSNSGHVCFGQLLGMGDHLSYPLAQDGFIVQKFLAYGDLDDVIPYIVRRGEENDFLSENAQLERSLYSKELKRRWKMGWHRVK